MKDKIKNKLIGSGSYGCVVQPPIDTNINKVYIKYTNKNKKDIGKIFKINYKSYKEFDKELKIFMERYKNIKDFDKLSIKLKGANSILGINKYNELYECLIDNKRFNSSFDNDTETYQLIYEYAGTNLHNIKCKAINFNKFSNMLYIFFKAFKEYQNAGYCHGDINYGNILINNEKLSLIDFGLEKKLNNIYNESNYSMFEHNYSFYPPEFRLYILYLKNNKYKINEILNYSTININSLFTKSDYGNFDLYTKFEIYKEILNVWKNFNINMLDPKKIDIYSLGVNLYIFRKCIKFNNKDELIKYNLLLKNMINMNVNKRYDVNDILNYIKNNFNIKNKNKNKFNINNNKSYLYNI
jgi:hypothetical protein